MSKGLRAEYDDDECWEYNVFTGEYNCECDNCNVYVGSAVLASSGLMLTVASAIFSLYYQRFYSAW